MFLAKLILFSVLQVLSCHGEYYSSTSGLEKLFETEVVLLAELQNYVNEINQHAEALSVLAFYKQVHGQSFVGDLNILWACEVTTAASSKVKVISKGNSVWESQWDMFPTVKL